MSEKSQWSSLRKHMKPLDPQRVENRVVIGYPDVEFVGGTMELKQIKRWPKNCDSSPVLLDHYTDEQRLWAKKRARAGGRVWLMLKVGKEWLLFKGEVAAEHLGRSSRPVLRALAYKVWTTGLRTEELLQCLR